MATLYRQYRPAKFGEVVGQDHVTKTLAKAIDTDRLTHAYLFHGPRGTGKTTTARLLAKRLNCEKPRGAEPCGKCGSCRAVTKDSHLDLIEIDAASNRGIDDIRTLRGSINTSPAMGKYKIYIIDEVHMLTNEAASALLKTLEEPVAHAVFILATTELHKVLPTILSRCQVYRFKRATDEEMQQRLAGLLKAEKRQANPEVIDFITERSDGCYRDAESLLGQILTMHKGVLALAPLMEALGLPDREILDNFLTALVKGESNPALDAAENAFKSGVDPEQFLREAVRLARDGAVAAARGQKVSNYKFANEPGALDKLPGVIRHLLQAIQDIAYVPQPLLAVQLAVLLVCHKKGERQAEAKQPTPPVFKEVLPAKSAEELEPSRMLLADQIELERVQEVWLDLINRVKDFNPVASTFLRAMKPIENREGTIVIKATYVLHRNFFETPKNKQLVEEKLTELLGGQIRINIRLEELPTGMKVPVAEQRRQQEEDFFKKVKEVFGEG